MRTLAIILALTVSAPSVAQSTLKKDLYADGSTKTTYVQEGKHVRVTHFHTNGKMKETGLFLNGAPDGKWETFAENGMKTAELNYANGVRHGEFRSWDAYSDSYLELHYDNGQVLAANRWVRDGSFARGE